MNLYNYVGNNPVNWIDPWGLKTQWEMFRDWLMDPSKNHLWNDPNHWTQFSINLGELLNGSACMSVCMAPHLLGYAKEESMEKMLINMTIHVSKRNPYVMAFDYAYSYTDSSFDAQGLFNNFLECLDKCRCE